MKITLLSFAFVSAFFLLTETAFAQGWRGIGPLHSTRADVERLLGPPKQSHRSFSSYETKTEEVR
jgi:hypothetical protein